MKKSESIAETQKYMVPRKKIGASVNLLEG